MVQKVTDTQHVEATHSWGAVEPLGERGPQQVFPAGVLIFIVSRLSDR